MNDPTNAGKLHLQADQIVWVIATNDEQGSLLDPLPAGVEIVDEAIDGMDAAILFVEDREALAADLDEVLPQLGSAPVVWIAYPLGNSGLSRDGIADIVSDYGWTLIHQVSLDDDWHAVQLRQS